MASRGYNAGQLALQNGTVNFLTDVIEVVLLKSSYVHDPDHTAGTPAASEITGVAGYVGGFGGAGRKALAGKSIAKDDATDRINYMASNPSQYTLGTGDTAGGSLIQKKGSASDATAVPLWFLDITDFPTNGGTFDLSFPGGIIDFIQV